MPTRTMSGLIAVALAFIAPACHRDVKSDATAGPGPSASAPARETSIKIGLITSLTGKFSALGSEDKKAVELAVEQVNAKGGLLGRQVSLLTRDDQTLPDQSVVAFNDMKGSDVVAIIGSPFSNSALATEPLAQREGIPYLSLTPAEEQVQPIKSYVFVIPALSSMYAERYLEYMRARKIERIVTAYDTKGAYAVSGHTAMAALAPKYGVRIVKDEEFETSTTDFSPLITHLEGTGAQAFVFWGTGPSAITLTKQYAAANVKIPLFMTGSQASKLWLGPVGAAGEKVTVSSAIGVVGEYLPDGPQKQVIDQMAAPFRERYGYPPPQFAQDGYSACLLLFEAVKNAGSLDHAKVQQALEHLSLVTPNGTFKYSPTDHSGLTPEFISVNVVSDGKFVPTDWAKEKLASAIASR